MKTHIEDYLYSLDRALGQKSERDKTVLYVLIFASLFALSYLSFWDSSEASFKMSHDKALKVQHDLDIDKQYLAANPPERIVQIERETAAIERRHALYIQYNAYIKEQIEQISSLYYDEKVWGAYLDSISQYAKNYNITLSKFGNTLQPNNSSFGHVLDISIASTGNYKNTLKFINALEQSSLVVDLHDFNLTAGEKLTGVLDISVWGIVRQ